MGEIGNNKMDVIIDDADINDKLNDLQSNIEDKNIFLNRAYTVRRFAELEKNINIDLDLGIGKDGKYYILNGKEHSNYLNVGLNQEEVFTLMEDLPILLDKKNRIKLLGDSMNRVIYYGEKIFDFDLSFTLNETEIKYEYTKGKNGKESDHQKFGKAVKNQDHIRGENNRIEEIFKFIKSLRGEIIEDDDISNGVCPGRVNQECIDSLGIHD